MLSIGLTGGIGSGKSTVARMLAHAGGRWLDADRLARQAVEPGTPGHQAVVDRFGPHVLRPDGRLDRPRLGEVVFADSEALQALNQIVHPAVRELARHELERAEADGVPFLVYDVPLLYENHMEDQFDVVAVVWAPAEAQMARVAARDGLSEARVMERMAAQMPLEEKVKRADYVFRNESDLETLQEQVREFLRRWRLPEGQS